MTSLDDARAASRVVDYELRHTTTGDYAVDYPEVNDALRALHNLVAENDRQIAGYQEERSAILRQLATPPPGWFTFGTHIDGIDGEPVWLEFWGDDGGVPIWERPIPDTDQRDNISRAIGGVLFNARNFPEKVQTRLLGQDMAPLNEKLTDAVLAAGFRQPGPITDAQVDAAARAIHGRFRDVPWEFESLTDRWEQAARAALEAARGAE